MEAGRVGRARRVICARVPRYGNTSGWSGSTCFALNNAKTLCRSQEMRYRVEVRDSLVTTKNQKPKSESQSHMIRY